jgi:hypothetical protein
MSDSTVPENPADRVDRATRRVMVRSLLVFSLVLNTAVVAHDLTQGHYRLGALQSIALALVVLILSLVSTLEAWCDVRLAGQRAQLRISELALQQLQSQITAMRVRVTTSDPGRAASRRWPDANLN